VSVDQFPLGLADLRVPAGAHIAFPYRDERERAPFLLACIKAGLENCEKCLAAVIEYSPDFWVQALGEIGIAAEPLLGKQLVVWGPRDVLGDRTMSIRSSPAGMLKMADDAVREGWRGLRVCTSMNLFLQNPKTLEATLEAEAEICRLIERRSTLRVCTLNERGLEPSVLDLCLQTHSLVFAGNELRRNADYVEPDDYLRRLSGNLRKLAGAGAIHPPFAGLDFADDTPVLKVTGEMDIFTAPQVEDLGMSLALVGHKRLVIDLSSAPFLDAAAISTILRIRNAAQSKGGRVAIYDPESPLRRIFEIIHLDEVVPIRHTFEEALREVEI